MIVIIEGIDGAGKSTLIRRLRARFKTADFMACPEDRSLMEIQDNEKREIAFAKSNVATLEKAIANNNLVFIDRCVLSGLAYSDYNGLGHIHPEHTSAVSRLKELALHHDIIHFYIDVQDEDIKVCYERQAGKPVPIDKLRLAAIRFYDEIQLLNVQGFEAYHLAFDELEDNLNFIQSVLTGGNREQN